MQWVKAKVFGTATGKVQEIPSSLQPGQLPEHYPTLKRRTTRTRKLTEEERVLLQAQVNRLAVVREQE